MLTVDRGSRHKEKNINDNVATNCLILIYHNYYIFDDTTNWTQQAAIIVHNIIKTEHVT